MEDAHWVALLWVDSECHAVCGESDEVCVGGFSVSEWWPVEDRPFVSCAAVCESEFVWVCDAEPHCCEFADECVCAECGVHSAEYFVEVVDVLCVCAERCSYCGHEECGGDAFSYDVSDGDCEVFVVECEEVVEVSAEFEAWPVSCGHFESWCVWEAGR